MKTKILLYSCVIRKGNVIQKENAIIQKENAILLQTSSYLVRKRSILPSHMFKVKKKSQTHIQTMQNYILNIRNGNFIS